MIHVEQQAEHLFIGQTESGHTLLFHAENDHEVEVLTAEGDKPQGKVVMPEAVKCEGRCYTVASIGKQAFMGCKELTEVLIPDSVKTIRPEAFRESGLTAVQAADVEGIDYSAFYGCTGLTTVEMPSLRWMGVCAFSRCSKLANFVLPETLGEIPNWAFDFAAFTKVSVPNSVKRIGDQAFFNNENLESVIIPSSVVDICSEAFVGTRIKQVVIPNPDAGVRYNAFPEDCEVVRVK